MSLDVLRSSLQKLEQSQEASHAITVELQAKDSTNNDPSCQLSPLFTKRKTLQHDLEMHAAQNQHITSSEPVPGTDKTKGDEELEVNLLKSKTGQGQVTIDQEQNHYEFENKKFGLISSYCLEEFE